jgi:DGQHR domain-containing protein
MYSVVLNAKQLIEIAYIDHFDAANLDGKGYQRPPIPAHYKKITKYFIEDKQAFLPTAILAAANPSDIMELEDNKLKINSHITIVDGQHRIEGLKNIQSVDEKKYQEVLENYEFPIIIMAIDENNRYLEINAFININKKGKTVSTDLAMQLSEKLNKEKVSKIETITKEMIDNDFSLLIATEIVGHIGNSENSMWYQLIKFGDDNTRQKPISISAFAKSIAPIIRKVMLAKAPLNKDEKIISKSLIIELINNTWCAVKEKWPQCFLDDELERYNIRKSVGVYALHIILDKCADSYVADTHKMLMQFKTILEQSPIAYTDWSVGGTFSGMTNSQSLKKVAEMIVGEVNCSF